MKYVLNLAESVVVIHFQRMIDAFEGLRIQAEHDQQEMSKGTGFSLHRCRQNV